MRFIIKLTTMVSTYFRAPGPGPCPGWWWTGHGPSWSNLPDSWFKKGPGVDTLIKKSAHHPTHHKLFGGCKAAGMVRYRLVWVGMVFIMVDMVTWSPDTLVPWSLGVLVGYLSFQRSKWAGGKNLRKSLIWTFLETNWSHGYQGSRHIGRLSQW